MAEHGSRSAESTPKHRVHRAPAERKPHRCLMADVMVMEFPRARTGSQPGRPWRAALEGIVDRLQHSREVSHNIRHGGRIRRLPSTKSVAMVLDKLTAALFPSHYGEASLNPEVIDDYVSLTLADALDALAE